MPTEITVPRLGWSMDEGRLVEWLKAPGDWVRSGDMLYVLEGDKAAQEIESFDEGHLYLPPDSPQPGDLVRVGQRLGYLLARNEVGPTSTLGSTTSEMAETEASVDVAIGPAARRLARELKMGLTTLTGTGPHGRITTADIRRSYSDSHSDAGESATSPAEPIQRSIQSRNFATPRARRLARERGMTLENVGGTGRHGRIRARDIVQSLVSEPALPEIVSDSASLPTGTLSAITPFRRTIADRMLAAVRQAAPVTLTTRVSVEGLIAIREQYRAWRPGTVLVPSYTEMFVKLVSSVLREHPGMTDQWREDGIFRPAAFDIAFAVQTDDGLVAPVVRDVSGKSMQEVSQDARRLIEAAKDRRLATSDLQGGVFTVTNLGAFGIDMFTPLLNLPQSAILGIGRIAQEPAVVNNAVVPQWQTSLSLTFDHRLLDGAPAAQFLHDVRQACGHPMPALSMIVR